MHFKYTLSTKMILLSVLAILLSIGGILLSVFRILENPVDSFLDALKSPLLILICCICIFIVLSVLIKSRYIVDGENYITQFGVVKSSFPIKQITAIVLDSDTHKLTIYVGERYSVLSLNPEWNDAFIDALRAVNPDIDFSFTLAQKPEEKPKNKRGKK